jgi:hypothetical protein
MTESGDETNDLAAGGSNLPHINVNQMSNAIASNLARQYRIPVFGGSRTEDPINFLRTYERVAKALKWDAVTMLDKFPNYLSECAEEWFYVNFDCALDNDDPDDPECVVKPKDYELKKRFLSHFLRGDYKQCLMKELSKRKHRSDESILSYITSIKAICYDLDKKMSSEQKISYIIEGLDDETAAQITYFNPQSVSDLERIARNVEQGREFLHKRNQTLPKIRE